jgi:hypothetical protein
VFRIIAKQLIDCLSEHCFVVIRASFFVSFYFYAPFSCLQNPHRKCPKVIALVHLLSTPLQRFCPQDQVIFREHTALLSQLSPIRVLCRVFAGNLVTPWERDCSGLLRHSFKVELKFAIFLLS